MMRHIGLVALVLAAAPVHPAFRYERRVQLPTGEAPARGNLETCVVLPLELLSHAAPVREDLRVMACDREVAYQVRTSSELAKDVGRPQQILNLGLRNGAVRVDVEMTEPRYSRALLRM